MATPSIRFRRHCKKCKHHEVQTLKTAETHYCLLKGDYEYKFGFPMWNIKCNSQMLELNRSETECPMYLEYILGASNEVASKDN